MKGGQPTNQDPVPLPANLSQAELSSNQQATAVPWLAGEQKIAVTWISPVYDLSSKNAPASGKK